MMVKAELSVVRAAVLPVGRAVGGGGSRAGCGLGRGDLVAVAVGRWSFHSLACRAGGRLPPQQRSVAV